MIVVVVVRIHFWIVPTRRRPAWRSNSCCSAAESGSSSNRRQQSLLERREQSIGETAPMQGRPETIARPRKMMPDRPRIQARVDPHEQDPQVGGNHVANRLAVSGSEFVLRWLGRSVTRGMSDSLAQASSGRGGSDTE